MKKLLFTVLLIVPAFMFGQITVDGSLTAQELVEDVLIGNPSFMVSNSIRSGGSDFGSLHSIGSFDNNGTSFPFSGIVLTSGAIIDVPGPNTDLNSAGGIGWPGDNDLEAITGVANTQNASFITFDFVAPVAQISMEFLMASEEYNQNFECSFADTFAIILTDNTTGISENIALVPNTSDAIQVINVHPEVTGQCAAVNEDYFDMYNYEPFNPAANALIDYNGQTVTFMVLGDLEIGNSYTMKIVVADALDTSFDSALFVRGNSFGAFPIQEEEPEDLVVLDPNGDGFEVFDLTLNTSVILGSQDPSTFDIRYFTSSADADANVNEIANPESYQNVTNPETIYYRMTNIYTNAYIIGDFQILASVDLGVDTLTADVFEMYPNPAKESIMIVATYSSEMTVQIIDIHGKLVMHKNFEAQNHPSEINISALDNGLYFVQIASEGNTSTKKLIKK